MIRRRLENWVERWYHLESRAEWWQMEFSPDKREERNFESSNSSRAYRVDGRGLWNDGRQMGFWLLVRNLLKVVTQVDRIVKRRLVCLPSMHWISELDVRVAAIQNTVYCQVFFFHIWQ